MKNFNQWLETRHRAIGMDEKGQHYGCISCKGTGTTPEDKACPNCHGGGLEKPYPNIPFVATGIPYRGKYIPPHMRNKSI